MKKLNTSELKSINGGLIIQNGIVEAGDPRMQTFAGDPRM